MRTLLATGLCAVALPACDAGGSGLAGDNFALDFQGSPSCVRAEMPDAAFPSAMTVEAWVRASPVESQQALVTWVGAFSLYTTDDGDGVFSDGADATSASSGIGWSDVENHHVAGTWDGEKARLYIDGQLQGFGPATLGADPGPELTIGCWGNQGSHLDGLVDEVRLSSSVRYDGSFEVPGAPHEVDDDTWMLFHFDEGDGDTTTEQKSGRTASLVGVDWAFWAWGDAAP